VTSAGRFSGIFYRHYFCSIVCVCVCVTLYVCLGRGISRMLDVYSCGCFMFLWSLHLLMLLEGETRFHVMVMLHPSLHLVQFTLFKNRNTFLWHDLRSVACESKVKLSAFTKVRLVDQPKWAECHLILKIKLLKMLPVYLWRLCFILIILYIMCMCVVYWLACKLSKLHSFCYLLLDAFFISYTSVCWFHQNACSRVVII